ncbi:hypothetical protein CDIK_1922 [Cucumispora dikerogammari]|nr:hypothetical protein CDIK_1922 [Cucumispora dikerogammari]
MKLRQFIKTTVRKETMGSVPIRGETGENPKIQENMEASKQKSYCFNQNPPILCHSNRRVVFSPQKETILKSAQGPTSPYSVLLEAAGNEKFIPLAIYPSSYRLSFQDNLSNGVGNQNEYDLIEMEDQRSRRNQEYNDGDGGSLTFSTCFWFENEIN